MQKLSKISAITLIAVVMFATMPLAVLCTQSDFVQVTHLITLANADPEATAKAKPAPSSPDYKLSINRGKTDIPITLTVYTENGEGIDPVDFVFAISEAAGEWDSWTSAGLVGDISEKSSGRASVSLNGENAVFFGDYSQDGVIAVASYWYSRATREIVECDIMFDTDFQWGDAKVNPGLMDLQNIATHELGHFFNLADIYDASKSILTMYGYSDEGDIHARDLAAGDIAGIQKVFGV
jgi:hypothetical protein